MKGIVVPARGDLGQVLSEIPAWTQEEDLVAFSEMPDPPAAGMAVWAGGLTSAREFVALAARTRCRLLYYAGESFEPDDFLGWAAEDEVHDEEGESELEVLAKRDRTFDRQVQALREQARSHSGDLANVAMCFVADGVAHYWAVQAPWLTDLEVVQSELQELRDAARLDQHEDELARSDAEFTQFSKLLQARADFRSAQTRTARRTVAQTALPAPAGDEQDAREHEHLLARAVWDASAAVDAEAHRIYTDAEADLQSLVDAVVNAEILSDATTVAVRKILVTDFLLARFDGYLPPRRTLELLVNDPRIKARRRGVPGQAVLS